VFTREVNGKTLRKSDFSGAGNDCVYLTAPSEVNAEVHDSKAERSLRLPVDARSALLKLVRN
jgi:hypothetical protein